MPPASTPRLELHPKLRELVAQLRGNPPMSSLSPAQARARAAGITAVVGEGPDMVRVEEARCPGTDYDVPVRIYRPSDNPIATILYFHAGGWIVGDGLDYSQTMARTLARASGCEVVTVDYRLAPEHPF